MFIYVHSCFPMFSLLYLCLPMFTRIYLCLLVFTYVYHCLLVYLYVIYIPWLRGVYQQYETRAPRYLPEAKPRADIEGRGSHIADTLREDMVHIICSIAYCNIKLHNCPPLLLRPFRLPPDSVLAPKKTNLLNRPFPPLF